MKKKLTILFIIITFVIFNNFENNFQKRISHLNYDFFQKLFETEPNTNAVIIVDIDEKSLKRPMKAKTLVVPSDLWNVAEELLKSEFLALQELDFDLNLTGFDLDEIARMSGEDLMQFEEELDEIDDSLEFDELDAENKSHVKMYVIVVVCANGIGRETANPHAATYWQTLKAFGLL